MAVIIPRFYYYLYGYYEVRPKNRYYCKTGKKNYYFCRDDERCYTYEEMLGVIENGNIREEFIEVPFVNHSDIARQFLKLKNVYSYRTKKVSEMSDDNVERTCHWYCGDNNLVMEWSEYETQTLTMLAIKWCEENGIPYTTKDYGDE